MFHRYALLVALKVASFALDQPKSIATFNWLNLATNVFSRLVGQFDERGRFINQSKHLNLH